jgi:hypothetical protein
MGANNAFGGQGSGPGDLDPGTPLTVAEAANAAGVGSQEIEDGMADGTLLFETERRGGQELPVIRLMDLADAYPALRPTPVGKADREVASAQLFSVEEADEAQPESPREAKPGSQVPSESGALAEAVRASGADRNALIHLCEDLETRLDLAERERQASTASLLMAQRRVLDLESQRQRRPMAMAAAATLGLFGLTLAFLAFRLPGTVSAAAREEVRGLELRVAEDAKRHATALQATLAAARTEQQQRADTRKAQYEAQIKAMEQRLEESRRLHAAELAKVADSARQQASDERAAAAALRAQEAQQRRAELRAWEERIQGAELATVAAREALKLERVLNGADRAAFRSELDEALTRHNDALETAMERMQKLEGPTTFLPFGTLGNSKPAPAPWWKRALDNLNQ